MIEIKEKEHCCGCSACVQICPADCIRLVEDREGFLYPHCNNDACINCGKCEDVCPVLNKSESLDQLKGCYVCYSSSEIIRKNSSSGGIFSVFAEEILKDGGIVYGAAFDSDFKVHHVRIDHLDQISAIQRSKYLQSRIEDTYVRTKNDLLNGRKVLYSGTNCQIEGLKRYLGRDYSSLVTVDILCHGTPSPMVWKLYLSFINDKYSGKVIDVNFRNKELGWKNFSLKINYDSDEHYEESFKKDTFMNLFLSNVILRPSCYNCQFKDVSRVSDITIGDAWGIKKIIPEMDDDKGTSLLIIHTEKGMEYADKVRNKIHIETIKIDSILPPWADSRVSLKKHPKREEFFERAWKDGKRAFNWWDSYRKRKRLKDRMVGKIRSILER